MFSAFWARYVSKGEERVLIVDSTDVSLDLNRFRKIKADLEVKEFKWGCSSSKDGL